MSAFFPLYSKKMNHLHAAFHVKADFIIAQKSKLQRTTFQTEFKRNSNGFHVRIAWVFQTDFRVIAEIAKGWHVYICGGLLRMRRFVANAALYPECCALSRMLRSIPNARFVLNAALYPKCAFYPECRALSQMPRFVTNAALYPKCRVLSQMPRSIPNAAFCRKCRALSRMLH
ncbi:MAG: hypothetical protein RR653_09210, partial [Clostridia bacterium]